MTTGVGSSYPPTARPAAAGSHLSRGRAGRASRSTRWVMPRQRHRIEIEPYSFKHGRASEFIRHAPDAIAPGDRVIICARVSGRQQERAGNLERSVAYLRREMSGRGAVVVGVCTHVGTGREPEWLTRAAALARRHDAKL